MQIKTNTKSSFILKGKMLSMFSPFSKLSPFEMMVYGLMVYYDSIGIGLDSDKLVSGIKRDTGKSRQVIYNAKVGLRKKGLIDDDGLIKRFSSIMAKNEFNFNFVTNE